MQLKHCCIYKIVPEKSEEGISLLNTGSWSSLNNGKASKIFI